MSRKSIEERVVELEDGKQDELISGTTIKTINGDSVLGSGNLIVGGGGGVPYTGATGNVDLGEFGLDAGFVGFDTTPTSTPTSQGTLSWDTDHNTLQLVMNGTVGRVLEDTLYIAKNQTGVTIPKGTVVRANGTLGASGRILITPFLADGTYPSEYVMGVTAEDILTGADGMVVHFGQVKNYDTSAYTDGDVLYASSSVAGGFTTTPPVAPNNIVMVAIVIHAASNGIIQVRTTTASNINNDEGVAVVSPSNGDVLTYNSTTGLWEDKAPVGVSDGDYGDITVSSSGTVWNIDAATVGVTELSATGTPSATTFLRGDNTWATPTSVDPAGWTTIVKSANQDVTNSATLVNDTDLKFSVVAGGHYMVDLMIATNATGSANDYKFAFAVSSGAMTGQGSAIHRNASNAQSNTVVNALNAAVTNSIAVGQNGGAILTSAGIVVATANFGFYCTANATLNFQFANNTAGIGEISRTWKGSILKYKRLD